LKRVPRGDQPVVLKGVRGTVKEGSREMTPIEEIYHYKVKKKVITPVNNGRLRKTFPVAPIKISSRIN